MRATTGRNLAFERQPDEEVLLHEGPSLWSGKSKTLKWPRGVRASAVSPAFSIITLTLLALVVLRSLCLHITSKQNESLGMVDRRLAAGGDHGEAMGNPSLVTPEICTRIQGGLHPVEKGGNGTPLPSSAKLMPPTGKKPSIEDGTSKTSTGPKAKRGRLDHEASGGNYQSAVIEWPDISTAEFIEGMLAAEDEEVAFEEWLLDPEEDVPIDEEKFPAAEGGSAPSVGRSASSAFDFQWMSATRQWKPMSSASGESGSTDTQSQPSRPRGSESIDLPEPAEFTDKEGSLSNGTRESLHSKESYMSDLSPRGSSSSTSPPSSKEPFELATSRKEDNATAGFNPAVSLIRALMVCKAEVDCHGNFMQEEPPSTSIASMRLGAQHIAAGSPDPFYRVPSRDPALHLPPFDYDAPDIWAPASNALVRALVQARNILVQQSLDLTDLERLTLLAAHLVRLGKEAMPRIPCEHAKAEMVRALACRFLLLDCLWAVCEAVGPSMDRNKWWPIFSESVVGGSAEKQARKRRRKPARSREKLESELREALLKFKRGVRPTTDEALALKEALFVGPSAPVPFKGLSWNTLKRDIEGSSDQRS
ncbi:hypothetical protein Emag_002826 [Eimeria magna]